MNLSKISICIKTLNKNNRKIMYKVMKHTINVKYQYSLSKLSYSNRSNLSYPKIFEYGPLNFSICSSSLFFSIENIIIYNTFIVSLSSRFQHR